MAARSQKKISFFMVEMILILMKKRMNQFESVTGSHHATEKLPPGAVPFENFEALVFPIAGVAHFVRQGLPSCPIIFCQSVFD